MKKTSIIFGLAAMLAAASCSTKSTENAEKIAETDAITVEKPAVAVAPVATDGKILELSDAALLAPGVKVEQLTVVDFNAVWCGPCRQLTPVVEELAAKYAGKVTFISVDVDKYGDLFEAYNLGNSIPVVMFLSPDGGRAVYVGTQDLLPAEKFEALVESRLK